MAIGTSRSTTIATLLTRLVIARAPEATEDLTTNGVVPIAERVPCGTEPRRPRPAAQHLVLCTEKHLRVFGIRKGRESRIPIEIRTRPFPHVPDHPVAA